MSLITTAAGALLSAGLVFTGGTVATAAPADVSSDCDFGPRLLSSWLRLPADLRGDLTQLTELDPGERRAEAREIRQGALDGEYGPGVQERVERRIQIVTNMSPELKSDLVELRAADQGERAELAREIADTALAGGYGEKAQRVAEHVQANWSECTTD